MASKAASSAPVDAAAAAAALGPPVHCIYLYYIRIGPQGGKDVSVHYYSSGHLPITDADAAINRVAADAHLYGLADPRCVGTSICDLVRRRISYVVFAINDARGGKLTGVTFRDDIANDALPNGAGKHTFKRFASRQLGVAGSDGKSTLLQLVYCLNDMSRKKKPAGPLGKDEREDFKFSLDFAKPAGQGAIAFAVEDSGGTNMGPPVPPPSPPGPGGPPSPPPPGSPLPPK